MSAHSETCIEIFEGLLDFAGEEVTIDGDTYDGVVSELTRDDIFAPGGMEDNGGYRIKLKLADFPTDPDEYVTVIARERTCQLIHPITRNNGHIEILCQRLLVSGGEQLVTEGSAELVTEAGEELVTEET